MVNYCVDKKYKGMWTLLHIMQKLDLISNLTFTITCCKDWQHLVLHYGM